MSEMDQITQQNAALVEELARWPAAWGRHRDRGRCAEALQADDADTQAMPDAVDLRKAAIRRVVTTPTPTEGSPPWQQRSSGRRPTVPPLPGFAHFHV